MEPSYTRAHFICLFVAGLILVQLVLIPQVVLAKGSVDAWELEQTVRSWGTQEVIASRNAVRIFDPLRQFKIVSKAPKWDVVYFSDKRKRVASHAYETYDGGLFRRMSVVAGAYRHSANPARVTGWIKDGTTPYCDLTCDRWVLSPKVAVEQEMSGWLLFSAPTLTVSKQISTIMCKQLCLPDRGSIALYFRTGHTKPRVVLQTKSVKRTKVDPSIFDVPKGYEQTTAEKVMFDRQEFDF